VAKFRTGRPISQFGWKGSDVPMTVTNNLKPGRLEITKEQATQLRAYYAKPKAERIAQRIAERKRG
jgi:hypothetical protein